MNTFTQTVTPEQATAWLDANTARNRKLKSWVVENYATAMRRGEWLLTGESLKFADGQLIDGQHRLTACVLAGVPFETVVIEDIDPGVFEVLDTGTKRTAGDALHIAGIEGGSRLVATAVALMQLRTGWSSAKINNTITRHQFMKYVVANEDTLRSASEDGRRIGVAIGLSKAWWSAVIYDLADQFNGNATPVASTRTDVHTVDPDVFTSGLVTGSDLTEGDPVLALRGWVIRSVVARTARTAREFGTNVANTLLAMHEGRTLVRVGGHRWSRENATWIRTDVDDLPG